jgi:sugar phosphate isomerase/epimerase
MHRREALRSAALTSAWGCRLALARRLHAIGVQLYTVRDAMARDVAGTLARVAEIGYREVEFAGYFDHSPTEIRAALDASGLAAPSAHLSLDDLLDRWDTTLDAARTVGHRYLTVPSLPESMHSADGFKAAADVFNRLGEKANTAGLRFAYHNHAVEFADVGGQRGYDILLDGTDPALVDFEMDVYWTVDGGADPLAYFAKYPGRFAMVHLKGRAADGAMTEVGSGAIDWAALLRHHGEAGIRHYFVEHDQPSDSFASIRTSYEYLRALRF